APCYLAVLMRGMASYRRVGFAATVGSGLLNTKGRYPTPNLGQTFPARGLPKERTAMKPRPPPIPTRNEVADALDRGALGLDLVAATLHSMGASAHAQWARALAGTFRLVALLMRG